MASFRVNKEAKTVVAAALPRPELWLPQSNLDLLFPGKTDLSFFFCYRTPVNSFDVVHVLKKALSQVLVPYYALAGEMVVNGAGEPEILCNNRGVDFEEAYADVELRYLDLHKPDDIMEGKLLPVLGDGVLAVQVTKLSCGGVVVGCTVDHRIADAYSVTMFCKSWTEMARSMPLSNSPSFRRSLLSPRRPKTFDSSVTDLYIPISKLPLSETESNSNTQPPPPLFSRIYSVSADKIWHIQLLANHENPNSRTKLEAFAAFLWKLIASGKNTGDNSCRLGIAVDGRTRIFSNERMKNYFGNVLSHSFGKKKCSELEKMPLSYIANEIHHFLEKSTTGEHFLGLIDFIEAHLPEPLVYRMLETKVTEEEPAVFVSSGRGFRVEEMDFGWGAPVFGSFYSPAAASVPSSYVMPFPCPSGNGDWVIYVRLSQDQIEVIENSAANVFKPFCLNDRVLSSMKL